MQYHFDAPFHHRPPVDVNLSVSKVPTPAAIAAADRNAAASHAVPAPAPPRSDRATSAARRLRSRAKSLLRRAQGYGERLLFAFGVAELDAALRAAQVGSGEVILVHCSYRAFRAFDGRPSDVVLALQRSVGTRGGVLMPTMPFTGAAVEWAIANPVVDLRRTPSRMGLVSEVFRRSPGVVRSIHPTHPAAAWGAAAALVAGHAGAATPCGEGSPYHRLLERDGRIVLLGADIDSLTFFHTAEALLESRLPQSPFTRETFSLRTIAADGTEHLTRTRLFDPAVSRRRNLHKLLPELVARRAWMRSRAGLLRIATVRARDVLEATAALAGRGIYAYDDYPDRCPRS